MNAQKQTVIPLSAGDPGETLLTYGDLSVRWKVPIQTLRIWVMHRKLKAVKLGRHVRFMLSYIIALEKEGGLI
jgi:hypothetical protein